MGKVCVRGFGVSIDGFGAGPNQGFDHPLGERGGELMNWFYPTRYFRSMIGKEGGTSTVRQYLLAGAIDEIHLAVSPVVLGRGEALFAGLDLPGLGYRVTDVVPTALATHLVLTR